MHEFTASAAMGARVRRRARVAKDRCSARYDLHRQAIDPDSDPPGLRVLAEG